MRDIRELFFRASRNIPNSDRRPANVHEAARSRAIEKNVPCFSNTTEKIPRQPLCKNRFNVRGRRNYGAYYSVCNAESAADVSLNS